MNLKTLREMLCRAQVRPHDVEWPADVEYTVDLLIRRIDQHRPVGPDGKHGNLHTPTCGCEDKK